MYVKSVNSRNLILVAMYTVAILCRYSFMVADINSYTYIYVHVISYLWHLTQL